MARSRKGAYTPTRGAFEGQTFKSLYAYRQANARRQGYANYSQERAQRRRAAGKPPERRASAGRRGLRALQGAGGWRDLGNGVREYSNSRGPLLDAQALPDLIAELAPKLASLRSVQFSLYADWPQSNEAPTGWKTTNIDAATLLHYAREARTPEEFAARIFTGRTPNQIRAWSYRQRK